MVETQGRKIEVFTAGCYLCEETLKAVEDARCYKCTVTEYKLNGDCGCGCIAKAKEYGIKTVPTIVIDGKIALEGKPSVEDVKKALVL